jgi:multiple sugar transport system ATP-binding protein
VAQIVLEHLTRRYADGTAAVDDVSLTIEDGEFFILVGPSGCGKSTLLNMIVGLDRPTSGRIRVDGEPVDALDAKQRNMAMVFQSYALYPHMTVRDNMSFPLRMAKLAPDEIRKRVQRAADMLELGPLLERKPRSLSGGQRQRAAMGRALVREPRAFLLDEPLSNLDARLRVQMRMEIARLQRELGVTTVYVTHDQTEAMTLGDRIAVLRHGVVQQVGTPRELYEQPQNLFVAGFIGSPAMNFLPARLRDRQRLQLPMAELPLPEPVQSTGATPLVAGIRPEDLHGPDDPLTPADAVAFEARVETVEWLGADLYVHLRIEGADPGSLAALPADIETGRDRRRGLQLVARLDRASGVSAGSTVTLRLAGDKLRLFDAAGGARLR